MALTRLDPRNFLWHVWWVSLSEREKEIVRPFEAEWYERYEFGALTIPEVQELTNEACRKHYAGVGS